MRILVTGNAGAGKTTLAKILGRALSLSVHGLDRVVWQPGWQKTPPEQKKLALEQLIASSDEWVIDGVSQTVMEAADTIIFLDVPRHICLFQCAKRNRHYLFRSRQDLPERCPEILIIPRLLRIIWNFPEQVRPLILAHLEQNKDKKVVYLVKNARDSSSIAAQLIQLRNRSHTFMGDTLIAPLNRA